jgi:molybdopterin synthase sulfur carrier subunit
MALTLKYFAALRDRMGLADETVDAPAQNGAALIDWLVARNAQAEPLSHPSVRLIINDEIAPRTTVLKDGDTVAFCPPFSGG